MKQTLRKELLSIFIVGLLLLPIVADGQQDARPITEEAVKLVLRKKELRTKDLRLFEQQARRRGVAFQLTPAKEQEIRHLGQYLGKKGLDDLTTAIRGNYRPDVSQQPTATPTPNVKVDEPKPNIIVIGYGKPPLTYDPAARIFQEGFAGQGLVAVVAEFRNAHERGRELSEAKDIRAHISYEPFEFYEKLGKGIKNPEKSTPGFANVDDGVWLGEAQPIVNFARGETKTLILAVLSPDGTFAAYSHPIDLRAGITVPFPRPRMLTADKYVVKVQITGGAKGEIAELYHFTITLRPEFDISFG